MQVNNRSTQGPLRSPFGWIEGCGEFWRQTQTMQGFWLVAPVWPRRANSMQRQCCSGRAPPPSPEETRPATCLEVPATHVRLRSAHLRHRFALCAHCVLTAISCQSRSSPSVSCIPTLFLSAGLFRSPIELALCCRVFRALGTSSKSVPETTTALFTTRRIFHGKF